MKSILISALSLLLGCSAVSAQYFCPNQGTVMFYKDANLDEKTESIEKLTYVEVKTLENGVVDARVESVESDSSNPLVEIKTYRGFSYDPATDITKVVVMTSDDFKDFVMTMIKQSAAAAGQHYSEMELNDIEKNISSKGQLEFNIDPKMEPNTKLTKSTLRLTAGAMTMTMNLWDAKFMGTESVTVEAGTFDCVKISYSIVTSTPNGNDKRYITEWFAKEIGPVRSIETDKKGNVKTETTLRVIK